MPTLANQPFTRMNGLGNEIVVVDLRDTQASVTAEEARAAAQPPAAVYDQLMVLHAPRTSGTDAYVRIYNSDGSEVGACGNGMRCIAELMFRETGKDALTFETQAGLLNCWKGAEPLVSTVDMGKPGLRIGIVQRTDQADGEQQQRGETCNRHRILPPGARPRRNPFIARRRAERLPKPPAGDWRCAAVSPYKLTRKDHQ